MRMVAVEGPNGKMLPENLVERIARYPQDAIHHGRAAAVSMTQATEVGTVYTLDEIDAISKIAKTTACHCTWMGPALQTLSFRWEQHPQK